MTEFSLAASAWDLSSSSEAGSSSWNACVKRPRNQFIENWYMSSSIYRSYTAKYSLAPCFAVSWNFSRISLILSSVSLAYFSFCSIVSVVSLVAFSVLMKESDSRISWPEFLRVSKILSISALFRFCISRLCFDSFSRSSSSFCSS